MPVPALEFAKLIPTRAKPKREEDGFQHWAVNYLRYTLPKHWIVHHSPNEEASKWGRIRETKLGRVNGFSDLIILGEEDVGALVPQIVPAAYLIELKSRKGSMTKGQKEFRAAARRLGFKAGVAKTHEELKALVVEWGLPTSDMELRKE